MRALNLRIEEAPSAAMPAWHALPPEVPPSRTLITPQPSAPHGEGAPTKQPADLLHPHLVDPPLWPLPTNPRPNPIAPEVTRLKARTDSIGHDAMGVYIPPRGDMSVWTARDGEDHRWGFSPGAVHLGSLTIPLCSGRFDAATCGFGVQPVFRDAYETQLRARLEIERQIQQGVVRDRSMAIRARRDSLRDSIPSTPDFPTR